MTDPRQFATRIVGAVDWQSEVSGFYRCPGQSLHTSPTGRKDCRVCVDGAPTIFCFHASCAPAVAAVTRHELAALLKVCVRTIDRMVAAGQLPVVRVRPRRIRFCLPDVVQQWSGAGES